MGRESYTAEPGQKSQSVTPGATTSVSQTVTSNLTAISAPVTPPRPCSVPTDSLEAHLAQIQDSVAQWWQKLKEPLPSEPCNVTILGRVIPNQRLDSSTAAAEALASNIWCTYRSGFEPIPRAENGPTPLYFLPLMLLNPLSARSLLGGLDSLLFHTDVGWGCMIRTSQSLLANTLQRVLESDFSRDARAAADAAAVETVNLSEVVVVGKEGQMQEGQLKLGQHGGELGAQAALEQQKRHLLRLFGDSYDCPFSLHNFVQTASQLPLEVKPGEWFGPSAASLSIKRLCAKNAGAFLPTLRVHVSENSDLCDEDMAALLKTGGPVLVLFPVRLGIDSVNVYYYPSILELLSLPQSVGIAGGKPRSSYYFVGYLGTNLVYLDPHIVQVAGEDPSLYHTSRCQTLSLLSLDPLMLIGILLLDCADYCRFKQTLAGTNKIISFHDRPVKKCVADEDYICINSLLGDVLDEYVDVSDQFSGENVLLHGSVASLVSRCSLDKFSLVEGETEG